jgi:hypothetical protein
VPRFVCIRRSDLFPVGTVVEAHPGNAVRVGEAHKPASRAVTTATVAADDSLTLEFMRDAPHALWAEVAGEHRVLRIWRGRGTAAGARAAAGLFWPAVPASRDTNQIT